MSVDNQSPVESGEPVRESSRRPLTRRERRRRVVLLVVLTLLLLLLSYVAFYWFRNRQLPTRLVDFDVEQTVEPPQYLYSITGAGKNELKRPVGVATTDGRVYVVDFGQHRVSVFSERGEFQFAFRDIGGGKALSRPNVIAIHGGEVWVTDRIRRALYVFDLQGKFLREFKPEDKKLKKWAPFAIAFADDGRFIVTDLGETELHKVHFFDAQEKLVRTAGVQVPAHERASTPEAFFFPASVAIAESENKAYISDGDNRRVQIFTISGEFLSFIDTSGIPRGSDIDSEQRLYVADGLAHNVDIYDLDGKPLTQFGSQGFGPGQFNYPGFVAVNNRGRIFVTDRENNQVQVWGWAVAQPPAIPRPKSTLGWTLCLSPLLLLPLLLLLRKRHVLVTPDFVELLIENGLIVDVSRARRLRLTCPEDDHVFYRDRVENGVDLGRLIEPEAHSESDVRAMVTRLQISEREAVLLSMAARVAALATTNLDLRHVALLADVRVVNLDEFRTEFLARLRR